MSRPVPTCHFLSRAADVGLLLLGITASRLLAFDIINSYIRRRYLAVIHSSNLITEQESLVFLTALLHMLPTGVWILPVAMIAVVSLITTLTATPSDKPTQHAFTQRSLTWILGLGAVHFLRGTRILGSPDPLPHCGTRTIEK